MPTATLINPRSLRILGMRFERGVETRIEPELVPTLELDDRFEVDASDVSKADIAQAVEEKAENRTETVTKPTDPDAVYSAIVTAYQSLDPDNENHFTKSGKADCRALSKILGYVVTAAERDEALGEDEDEDDTATPGNLKIKKSDGAAPVDV